MVLAKKSKREEIKVIVDANTLIRAVIHPRFAFEILKQAFDGSFELFLLAYTIEEATRNVAKRFPNRLSWLEKFLLQAPYQLLENPTKMELKKYQDLIRHENDLPLAIAAVKNNLDYLVSNDEDFVGIGKTTKKIQSKITCLTAGNFLKEVMGWSSAELSQIKNRQWPDLEE